MVRFQVGKPSVVFAGTLTKPEEKPPSSWEQGLAKEDWATVWFPGDPEKTKVMVEPTVALIMGGMNWKTPP